MNYYVIVTVDKDFDVNSPILTPSDNTKIIRAKDKDKALNLAELFVKKMKNGRVIVKDEKNNNIYTMLVNSSIKIRLTSTTPTEIADVLINKIE